jgi:hypothetical protein
MKAAFRLLALLRCDVVTTSDFLKGLSLFERRATSVTKVDQRIKHPEKPLGLINMKGKVGGAEAASMAARACELTRNREALGTLAAACAEAGRFDQAASLAQRAHDVAVANGDTNAALRNLELKKTYQARQPFYDRDPSPPFRGTCPPSVHAIR